MGSQRVGQLKQFHTHKMKIVFTCVECCLGFCVSGCVCLVNISWWLLVSFIDCEGEKKITAVYQNDFVIIYKNCKMI